MANFTVSPQGLRFNTAPVQGTVSGLYATPQTLSFTFTNTSGASVTITNYGFSNSTEGDAVTQPAGVLYNSDFTVAVHSGSFPVTVANGASQQFDVTYAPLRRGSGFGDIRSVLIVLFSGYKALSNGGSVFNSAGELINETLPQLVTVGAGGGVTEEGYDWPSVHPIYWSAGVAPSGDAGVTNKVQGMTPNMTLADVDTVAHGGPMMFWNPNAAWPNTATGGGPTYSATTPWTARAPVPGHASYYDVGGSAFVPATNYDYGTPQGGRGYQILPFFSEDSQQFDLTIWAVVTGPAVVQVAFFPGLTYSNVSGLFIGNTEGLDLQGLVLVAGVSNITNPGGLGFNVGAVITG